MKIGILGTGAFGIALSHLLDKEDNDITMWTTFKDEKQDLEKNRVRINLNNYRISDDIKFTTDIKEACLDKDIVYIVVPAEYVSDTCLRAKDYITNQIICIASKGIEESSSMFLPDIVKNIFKSNRIGVISGPTFAIDIVSDVPIGFSIASYNPSVSRVILDSLNTDLIKVFTTNDVIGTSLCGAVKNVLAIASGMVNGLGYPISTQAMLITQSLHDVEELIYKLGGNGRTILSFAGFGDIILTCTSEKSRNYSFGKLIGEGIDKKQLAEYIKTHTIEGLVALRSFHNIINDKKIDIPIINLIYDIVYNDKEVGELITLLTK